MIVDRMLPGLDGLAVIQALRAANVATPILILSALGQVDDRVTGLKAGGDDYLTKPFAFSELLARLEALPRRRRRRRGARRGSRSAIWRWTCSSRPVKRAGQAIDLQPREFRLLEYLMRHAGQVVTRTMLLEGVWDYHFDPQTNVIDVHISRLRQKIDKGFATPLLHTVRGAGYCLRADNLASSRTTTFRLALLYAGLFCASVLALFAFVYWTPARSTTREREQRDRAPISRACAAVYEQRRPAAASATRSWSARAAGRAGDSIYLLADADLEPIAGNARELARAAEADGPWMRFGIDRSEFGDPEPHRAEARTFAAAAAAITCWSAATAHRRSASRRRIVERLRRGRWR